MGPLVCCIAHKIIFCLFTLSVHLCIPEAGLWLPSLTVRLYLCYDNIHCNYDTLYEGTFFVLLLSGHCVYMFFMNQTAGFTLK